MKRKNKVEIPYRHSKIWSVYTYCIESNRKNNYAANNNDLAEILKRSASPMEASGNSLDQVLALGVGAQEIVQNSVKVGRGYADYKNSYIG